MNSLTQNYQNFKSYQKFHFVGIGGVSMSALALILKGMGKTVTGSDANDSEVIKKLKSSGITVSIGHNGENVKGCEILIYTAAISDNNPELVYAKQHGIPIIERAVLLGKMMSAFKNSIAVAGTHGKTTTTSMLSTVFIKAAKDPTVLVGARLKAIDGNYRVGRSDYAVYEACEYVNSYLHFYPDTAVILNIDADHLDFFKDIDAIKESFLKFTSNISDNGRLIINGDDTNCQFVIDNFKGNIITFGLNKNNTCFADNITLKGGRPSFDVYYNSEFFVHINLSVFGSHNILNALAVCCAAKAYNIKAEFIKVGLEEFTGADRRFQVRCEYKDVPIIDDYAHHPTEISATINAAKNAGFKKITVVFQPHTYTRTFKLMDQFANALSDADRVILTDIYSAREINTIGVNILDLKNKLPNSIYISDFDQIAKHIKDTIQEGEVVILMGAGNVNSIAEKFK